MNYYNEEFPTAYNAEKMMTRLSRKREVTINDGSIDNI